MTDYLERLRDPMDYRDDVAADLWPLLLDVVEEYRSWRMSREANHLPIEHPMRSPALAALREAVERDV